jgi:8-oxo-dGTP pyrophosphatase MutT (NUDIX family)
MSWKKILSKNIYKNKWIEVVEDKVKTDTGRELTFGVVHKKPYALIIPWDGEKLTLVGQYRYSVGEFSWEFPQGHYQLNSIIKTAKEELREETGIVAKKIKQIYVINLAAGLPTSQKCHIFLATDLREEKNHLEESEEDMKIKKVTEKELLALIKKGKIKDGPTIAAFGLAKIKNLLK